MDILENCSKCKLSKKIYVRSSMLCRKCRTIESDKTREAKGCMECGKLCSLSKGRCHACYERNRRSKLIEEAKNNPEKAEALRQMYRRDYLKNKDRGHYKTLSRRVSSSLNAFRTRDPETDLDEKWFIDNIVDKNCHYCGISDLETKEITKQFLHVDKKIPSIGYKKSNCVPACKACNTAKLDLWSYEEALEIGKVIRDLYNKRKVELVEVDEIIPEFEETFKKNFWDILA